MADIYESSHLNIAASDAIDRNPSSFRERNPLEMQSLGIPRSTVGLLKEGYFNYSALSAHPDYRNPKNGLWTLY
jgi:hypothetical protein